MIKIYNKTLSSKTQFFFLSTPTEIRFYIKKLRTLDVIYHFIIMYILYYFSSPTIDNRCYIQHVCIISDFAFVCVKQKHKKSSDFKPLFDILLHRLLLSHCFLECN